ncbi:MAG: DUF4097 family beta strand repeat-containing protein [Armatimonadota bacterium]|jgi:hypothetical protein
MRAGLIISVLVVMGLAYLVSYAWHRTAQATKEMAQDLIVNNGSSGTETSRATETFDVGGKKRLAIANDFGSVEVTPGGPAVSAERIVFAGQDDEARARAARFKVESNPDGADGVALRVVGEKGPRRVRVKLIVQAPPELDLKVDVSFGDVSVTGWKARVDAAAGSGNATLKSVAGAATAKSGSGNVTAENMHGGIAAESGSGNVDLSLVRGRAYAHTGSGDVNLADIDGSDITAESEHGSVSLDDAGGANIRARTHSGDVRVSVKKPFSGTMEIHTGSGDASLALPPGSDCRIEARTGSGSVNNELTMKVESSSERAVTGYLGKGAGSVQITTGSGDVSLEAAGKG